MGKFRKIDGLSLILMLRREKIAKFLIFA